MLMSQTMIFCELPKCIIKLLIENTSNEWEKRFRYDHFSLSSYCKDHFSCDNEKRDHLVRRNSGRIRSKAKKGVVSE